MRKILIIIPLLIAVLGLMLSGCSFELRSIDSLMRPPHTATESELKNSINKLLGDQISYRSPESGENHSAITLRDINGDGIDEAIVFYVKNDDVSVVRMCVLTQKDDSWILVSDFAGNGNGVLSVSFDDLNSDSDEEIMVSWFLFDDKSQTVMSVYTSGLSEQMLTVSACLSEPYNLMTVSDVFGSNGKQLIIAYSNLTKKSEKTTLKLISIDAEDEVQLINEIKLDDRITKLSSIVSDIPAESTMPRFYIDAAISDTQSLTQVIEWNSELDRFVFLLDGSADADITVRNGDLLCRDIDGDGIIEIPLSKPMSESVNSDISLGFLLEWCKVDDERLVPSEYYVVNLVENYSLYYPAEWKNKIFVKSDNAARTWNFVNTDDEVLFNVTAFNFNEWDENSANVTEMLMMQNDTVYCCTITPAGEIAGITEVDLLKYFSLNL